MPFEYVTSTVSLLVNDGIAVHVLNNGASTERARIQFFENTGAGAVQVADSGDIEFIATGAGGTGLTVQKSGEYWVRIRVSSEFLVAQVSFERLDGTSRNPIIVYSPRDFAVFELPHRIW
ncbi:hypothetical protein [Paraburkholderia sp. GAS42]|uniref:hypothetical protein n=1 Tax=Paraburkholderia sp. GAS42 TaxID=3035135 RepID=UPI003D25F68B